MALIFRALSAETWARRAHKFEPAKPNNYSYMDQGNLEDGSVGLSHARRCEKENSRNR